MVRNDIDASPRNINVIDEMFTFHSFIWLETLMRQKSSFGVKNTPLALSNEYIDRNAVVPVKFHIRNYDKIIPQLRRYNHQIMKEEITYESLIRKNELISI